MSFGSKTEYVQQPSAPSATATAGEAIQADLQYGDQIAARDYRLATQYSPLYADLQAKIQQQYGEQLGSSYYDMVKASNPYIAAVEEAAAQDILTRLGESDADLLGQYQREYAAQEASAGRLGAPVGSLNMARNTVQAREAIRQSRVNEALALSGKTPVTSAASIQPTTPNTQSSYVQPFLGYASNVYNTQAGMFNASQNNQAAMRGQNMQLVGAGIGAVGTMGAAYLGR